MKAFTGVLALCLVMSMSGCEAESDYDMAGDYGSKVSQQKLKRKKQRQRLQAALERQRAAVRKQRRIAARKASVAAAVAAEQAAAESYASETEPSSPDCDPNYAGACLDPNSYDYDCAGGSGDGPDYTGYVEVVGTDIHGLDADSDGIGCE